MDSALKSVLMRTLHMDAEAVPWAPSRIGRDSTAEPQTWVKLLHYHLDDDLTVSMVRAEPFAETAFHRHVGHTFGWTTLGAWGHNRDFEYTPGVYSYETPGVVHQFINGPNLTEVLFINQGVIEFVDPEAPDEVTGILTAGEIVRTYFESCEASDLGRPNILNSSGRS